MFDSSFCWFLVTVKVAALVSHLEFMAAERSVIEELNDRSNHDKNTLGYNISENKTFIVFAELDS